MYSIIIPLYVDKYSPQIDLTLNYYNCLSAMHEVIVIDDCSSDEIPYKKFKGIKFARITTDIDWNQPGARNLGAHLATQKHLVFMDVDHLIPSTFTTFNDCVTLFKRLYNGKTIKQAQGIAAIPTKMFKGYDEDFCGNYGKEDKFFLMMHGKIKTIDDYLICLNSKTHSLTREKESIDINQTLFDKKYNELLHGEYQMGKQLRFNWKLI